MPTDIATAMTVLPAATNPDEAMSIVRAGSPLAHALEVQGVATESPGAQRAVSKAVQSLARDIMEGAMLLASDAGNERAKQATACLNRVRAERATANRK